MWLKVDDNTCYSEALINACDQLFLCESGEDSQFPPTVGDFHPMLLFNTPNSDIA